MKKLLVILACLICYLTQAQTIQYLGSPTTQIYVRGQLRVDTIIYLPLTDTTFTPSQKGALVFKSSNNGLYLWNGLKWNLVPVGSTAWGTITASISSQADLIALLNGYQPLLTPAYGVKIASNVITWDSANVRKVDTMFRTNDSTLSYRINGVSHTVLLRGTPQGGINSLVLTVPSGIYTSPVTFNNTAAAWTGTLSPINQSANNFLAGPSTGSPAIPTFRLITTADLPANIPNGNLANSSINLASGTAGTAPGWGAVSVSLGGTATYNEPITSGTNTGVVTPSFFNFWNAKVDSTIQSNDSIYEWRNGTRFFRYLISVAASGLTSLNGLTASSQTFAIGSAGTGPVFVSSGTVHTLNIPFAASSSVTLGGISNTQYNTFTSKEPAIAASNTVKQYYNGYKLFVGLNTDSVLEGAINLFYTNTRARAAISITTTGTSGAANYNNSTGVFNIPNYQAAGSYLTQLFAKGGGSSILGTDTVKTDTLSIVATTTALNDTTYQRDPYTWQTSIVSPLADSAIIPAYRQDAPSIASFANGVKISSWSGFPNGAQVGDNQPSNIVGSRSYNNGLTWATPVMQVSGAISNMGHVSTPSLFIQPNGNVIMIVNVKNSYAVIPSPKTGTNFYRYLSTDSGFTYVLQDSLIASVTRYAGITNNRIVRSQRTGRLFMPFLEQTSISAHYQVGSFYSDNLGVSWTDFGWRVAQADSSADEPGAFVLQNAAPVDTAGGVEKIYFYWTNSGQVLYAYSQDNGATVHGNYAIGIGSTQTVLSLISCNNETQVVGLLNRQMVNCCSTQGGQRKFVDLIYSNDVLNWQTIASVAGWDSGYHYFEQAITWDSIHSEFMSAISRMNDQQTRSDIRWYRIPTRTAIAPRPVPLNPLGPIVVGMDIATLTNAQPGLMVYNRNIDNLATNGPNGVSGFTQFNTVSGSTFWPGMTMRATTDGPLGGFLQGWVGSDVNSQYYSAAFDFVGHPHSGVGSLVNCPIARFINNATPVFIIGPTGSTEIADSVQLDKVRDGTTADSVAVLKQISTGKFLIHKVAQSSIATTSIRYQHTIFTPTTGGTVNLINNQYNIINPAGALLALTVNLPSSPANNDVVYIKYTQTISTVTYGNGTVVDGITAPTAGGVTILTYDSGTTSWY